MNYERKFILTLQVTDTDGDSTTFEHSGTEDTWHSYTELIIPMLNAIGFSVTERELLEKGLRRV